MTLDHFETGEAVGDTSRFISANAYLGCWGIVDALDRGADIVITGRTTDAAVVCGPAAWHHRWARDDWDRLAGAVVAGHIIECGTQAAGGNYSFFTELDGLEHTGFPWAEIADDGASVIGKHDGTGGAVTVGTVTSQLLYEIDAPAYLGPDVTARFDTVSLEQSNPDRVRVSGTRGEPPPPNLKVAMNELGGFRSDLNVALTGLDIEAKATLVEDAFWAACPFGPSDYAEVATRVVRTDKDDPASNEEAVATWRLTLKDPDERKVKAAAGAVNELALATIPGMFGIGGGSGKPFGVYRPALVPADLVPQHVVVLGADRTVVDSVAPAATVAIEPLPTDAGDVPSGETVRVPFGAVFGTRSGDKGGQRQPGRVRPLGRGVCLARRVPDHRTVAGVAARDVRPGGRPPPPRQHPVPQLPDPRDPPGGRGRLDPPGRPGQEPGRVAAGPPRRPARRPPPPRLTAHPTRSGEHPSLATRPESRRSVADQAVSTPVGRTSLAELPPVDQSRWLRG